MLRGFLQNWPLWGGGRYLCDAMDAGVRKIGIVMWQKQEWSQFWVKLAWRHIWMVLFRFSDCGCYWRFQQLPRSICSQDYPLKENTLRNHLVEHKLHLWATKLSFQRKSLEPCWRTKTSPSPHKVIHWKRIP